MNSMKFVRTLGGLDVDGETHRQMSSTRRASPLMLLTFMHANLMPSGAMTSGVCAGRSRRASARRERTIVSSCGVV